MIQCTLDGHSGTINVDSGCCVFYGILFDGIVDASKFFKGISVGPPYKGKIIRGVKVLEDPELDMWYSEGRWWPDKSIAVKAAKRMLTNTR